MSETWDDRDSALAAWGVLGITGFVAFVPFLWIGCYAAARVAQILGGW